jgi:amidase
VPRAYFYDEVTAPGAKRPTGGLTKDQSAVMAEAIEGLRNAGAVIVDPADIPSVVSTDADNSFLNWNVCSGVDGRKGKDEGCSVVFKYGMKRDFNAWLASLGPTAPVKTLTDLRFFNLANVARNAIKYGQSQLDISDEMDLVADKARYEADRRKDLRLAGTEGIEAIMKAERLDALLFPAGVGAGIAARPGYPTVMVPFGRVPNAPTQAFPPGFDALPAPFSVSFTGLSCSEPRLIEIAYAFEQATKRRVPPPSTP